MRDDYDELSMVVPWFAPTYSFQEFLQVRTAVGSRNFGIMVDGQKRTSLVPFADMLNHFRPRETSWAFDSSKRCFSISSLQALQPGQQVLDSYGRKDNARFLLHYGFAVENNREEGRCQNEVAVCLRIGPPPPPCSSNTSDSEESDASLVADPLAPVKRAFLGSTRCKRVFKMSMNREDKGTSEALAFARIIAASENELEVLVARSTLVHSSATKFISPRNEAQALRIVADVMQEHLQGYEQPREQNLLRVNSDELPKFSPQRSALIVLVGEQEVCEFWIRACKALQDCLLAPSGLLVMQRLAELPNSTVEEADLFRYATWIAGCVNMSIGT
jgi:histone-lysine N-methyltransferase SETD3